MKLDEVYLEEAFADIMMHHDVHQILMIKTV